MVEAATVTQTVGSHWGPHDEWTGYYLLIVPVGEISAANVLYKDVRAFVDADVVLSDGVTIGLSPAVDGFEQNDDAVMTALISGAMARGYFFAPRAMFGFVLVGTDDDTVAAATQRLQRLVAMGGPPVHFSTYIVSADENTKPTSISVQEIVGAAMEMMAIHAREPGITVSEVQFLIGLGLLSQDPQPNVSRSSNTLGENVLRNPPPAPTHSVTDNSHIGGQSSPPNQSSVMGPPPAQDIPTAPRREPSFPQTTAPERESPPAKRDEPTNEPAPSASWRPFGRSRSSSTEVDSLNRLARNTNAVALIFLIFVPDEAAQPRSVAKRKQAVALELDSAFSTMSVDVLTGRAIRAGIAVLYAGSPLVKCCSTQPAGALTGKDLPKVKPDGMDFYETAGAVLEAREQTLESLTNRNVDALSSHFIFLSTAAPLPNPESIQCFDDLAKKASITWIHFGSKEELISNRFKRQGVNQVHLLLDQPDIVASVVHLSSPSQRYEEPGSVDSSDGTTASENVEEASQLQLSAGSEPDGEQLA